jgi:hypothetical protein
MNSRSHEVRKDNSSPHGATAKTYQGGTQSDQDSRWIERIQTVRETCRLQDRPVLGWPTQSSDSS